MRGALLRCSCFLFLLLCRRGLLHFCLRLLLFFFFGLRLFGFLFLFRSFLALFADERDLIADVNLAPFCDINFSERAVLGRFPFHRCLVRFNFSDHFAGRNFVALFLFPRDDGSLRHCVAQLGHLNFGHIKK